MTAAFSGCLIAKPVIESCGCGYSSQQLSWKNVWLRIRWKTQTLSWLRHTFSPKNVSLLGSRFQCCHATLLFTIGWIILGKSVAWRNWKRLDCNLQILYTKVLILISNKSKIFRHIYVFLKEKSNAQHVLRVLHFIQRSSNIAILSSHFTWLFWLILNDTYTWFTKPIFTPHIGHQITIRTSDHFLQLKIS